MRRIGLGRAATSSQPGWARFVAAAVAALIVSASFVAVLVLASTARW